MKKIFKNLFSLISAITVFMTCSFSVFSWADVSEDYYPPAFLDEYTHIDDKGMFKDSYYYKIEGYKYIYYDISLYRAEPLWRQFVFILNDNVNQEEVDSRICGIFKEFFPEENYADAEYMPKICATEYHGKEAYICYFASRMFDISSPDDERIAEAIKSSKDMMKKLYEENLIVAFYDFGETYDLMQYAPGRDWIRYEDGADTIEEYIKENNIDCDIERAGANGCELLFSDDVKFPERMAIAADIYEATSIKCKLWGNYESTFQIRFGKNSLEDLPSSTTPAETTPTETTTTTLSTTVTTELTTEPTKTTTSTAISTFIALPTATTVTSITTTIPVETTVSETLDTTLTTITSTTTTTITSQPKPLGDADGDNELTVRDCSFIALTIAQGRNDEFSDSADFNKDGEINVRDAAAIAKSLAQITN